MNIIKKLFGLIFSGILFVLIVTPSCTNAAASTTASPFKCEGNIFNTLNYIRDSGAGGAKIDTDAYVIFKIAGCALAQLTTYILGLAGVVAVIMIMISGLKYMTSAGNPSAQQNAVKSLNASVIGFIILLVFWSLFAFLLKVLQV